MFRMSILIHNFSFFSFNLIYVNFGGGSKMIGFLSFKKFVILSGSAKAYKYKIESSVFFL